MCGGRIHWILSGLETNSVSPFLEKGLFRQIEFSIEFPAVRVKTPDKDNGVFTPVETQDIAFLHPRRIYASSFGVFMAY
jgi:hypothetical protein